METHAQYPLPYTHSLPISFAVSPLHRDSVVTALSAQAAAEYVRAGVEAKLAKGSSEAIDP